ncbi:hypothetical protein NKI56_29540, partial [Mesorhizobium sp. M0622]
ASSFGGLGGLGVGRPLGGPGDGGLGGAGPVQSARARPIGFSLMATGLVGLVLAFRFGGRRPENPNSQPPPRWGRGSN